VKKELNSDNLFENYGSETGFGLVNSFVLIIVWIIAMIFPEHKKTCIINMQVFLCLFFTYAIQQQSGS